MASVIRAKNTAPKKKQEDRSNAARPGEVQKNPSKYNFLPFCGVEMNKMAGLFDPGGPPIDPRAKRDAN